MDSQIGLYVALFVCLGLLVACLIGGCIYLYVTRKKAKKQIERTDDGLEALREEELPEEVLLAILTAAALSVLGEEKSTSFRVVSFRRLRR